MSESKPTDPWGSMTYEFRAAWRRFWGLSWWWKGSILGGAALVLIIIIAAAAGGGGEDDDGGDVAEITASPTPTVAGETPEPTPTVVGETPEPTVEIPTEVPADAELERDVEFLFDAGILLTQAGVLLDGYVNWSGDTAAEYGLGILFPDTAVAHDLRRQFDQYAQDVEALDPPDKFGPMYRLWLSANEKMGNSFDLAIEGVETFEVDLIELAADEMSSAVALIEQATTEMELVSP